ncbi:capsular polysaccharide export protein [Cognatiyoonia koreensis]|uniref:Capsular polysaccharide export protein n=1 Tax=Cognatiyoonia koreensis TaxID=364200 RepID=A0A1I0NBK7_9RHOB|nr:capsular polysaccharide biosynthesis protein [Cognatiyoonia koreensis]SEV98685.1 capsular polysaccharide export protein [Cognatiyoonia koreensis]
MGDNPTSAVAGDTLRRLYVYNGGFLTQKRIRRVLTLAGYDIRLGKPGDGDAIGVWGHSPTAPRGEMVAEKTDAPIIRVEDAFLRSVLTGRDGDAPLGLHIDKNGVHFDPGTRSDLEQLLAEHPLDDTALLNRAKDAIADLQRLHLSKYNAFDPTVPAPAPGYVVVIDQTRGDASIKASGCDSNTFKEMLYYAQSEHPSARIIIKTHPETRAGHREGYFKDTDCTDRISLMVDAISPYTLLEGAIAVYTVSSQMGFEAILMGHKPVVFGQPFYIGWGLSDDRKPLDRRQRKLTRAQLFAAAMILYPVWYDPYRDRLCQLEDVIATLWAQARAWRDDHQGLVAAEMSLWKRRHLQAFFGSVKKVVFGEHQKDGRRMMIWASKAMDIGNALRLEDGFIRSRGLGADLIAPLSLVLDDLGIYYDPSHESRLERLIEASVTLPNSARLRAEKLVRKLSNARLSKYNVGETRNLSLPMGRRILVPGQVEDDASILKGCSDITTNAALLDAVRAANPAAVLVYKPHPDVEAGLRDGDVPHAAEIADVVLTQTDAITAIDAVDEVWTMTSLIGFEALLRGKKVTCFGTPFYAGWGLTDDRAMPVTRRVATPDLTALAHAVLIDYPRYFDPVTQMPCPPEVAVDRLADDDLPKPGAGNRTLAKLQGLFASYAYLWRR